MAGGQFLDQNFNIPIGYITSCTKIRSSRIVIDGGKKAVEGTEGRRGDRGP